MRGRTAASRRKFSGSLFGMSSPLYIIGNKVLSGCEVHLATILYLSKYFSLAVLR